jgi:hypothetical protein
MSDEEVPLHPSRPPTEAEHRFARAVVGVLRFLLDFLAGSAFLAGVAAFVRGVWILLFGNPHEATSPDGFCVGLSVTSILLVALSLLIRAVKWVRWASGTKPARREHDGDWRDFDA